MLEKGKSLEIESRSVVARGWLQEQGLSANGRSDVWGLIEALKNWIMGDDYTTLSMLYT